MTDPTQIPHLIKLLDDESLDVRATVAQELAAFGPILKSELKRMAIPLNLIQGEYVSKILEGHKRIWLKHVWSSWVNCSSQKRGFPSNYQRLEGALAMLSEFLNGVDYDFQLSMLLDELAEEYKINIEGSDPRKLAKFLFKKKGLRGDENDYYNSQNSNLVYVIKEKKGIPISLAAVYMLVGLRLGLKIEGCHFPGHFLARIKFGQRKVFVDCFNGGHMIEEQDLFNLKEKTFRGMERILHEKLDIQMMVRAFLANLIRSYQIQKNKENSELLVKLFSDMDMLTNSKKTAELTPEDIINYDKPIFKPGERVCHVRYGYRGIIVDVDQDCMAPDDWYYGNQTQPSRHQRWYHVLVHESDQVTYVAENNLIKDTSNKKVIHPLMSYFFTKTKEGWYIRNDNIWPGTDF